MKNLVIVESPTKARTISRFLGNDYDIKASMGHLMDLPKSTLGVDVEKNFKPLYELITDKKDIISELQKAAKDAETIILATDPDREGEAIAAHVKEILSEKKNGTSKFKRIVFHEITDEAIQDAIKNPRSIDEHLVDAQTARRVLDRLVGYKLSPLLWQKVRRGLSAGRVQSVALRLIVEREKEIEKFKKESYWTVTAFLKPKKEKEPTDFELVEINNEKIEEQEPFSLYDGEYKVTKTTITMEQRAKEIVSDLDKKTFVVAEVAKKETRRSPQPPYTTSTLQQDAARRFGYSGKKTMSLAQKLYEEGYITYHRTDSLNLSVGAVNTMRSYVKKEFGDKYIPDAPRFYKTKQKLAQEAHESIRQKKVNVSAEHVSKELGRDYWKVYDLIWKRAVASQMSDAIIESTTVLVDATGGKDSYLFKTNGSILVFDGFLKVNPQALQDRKLPDFIAQEHLDLVSAQDVAHETPPPPRYNDASLIGTLEEKGIGRPSTYATIVSTIESRQYIERSEGRFIPTPVGEAVNDFLVSNFSTIDDIPFTADMEDQLDSIANGEKEWVPVLKDFYSPFEKKLSEVKDAKRVKIAVEEVDEKCPQCGSNLVIRIGRFGKFLSCSTFPDCKFTKPFVEKVEGQKCPKDGGDIVIKRTKKGRVFFGCSNYPKCDFAAWKLKDIGANAKGETEKKETAEEPQVSEEVKN